VNGEVLFIVIEKYFVFNQNVLCVFNRVVFVFFPICYFDTIILYIIIDTFYHDKWYHLTFIMDGTHEKE